MEITLGVDLGGTSTRVGAFDSNMRLLANRVLPTQVSAGPKAAVANIAATTASLLKQIEMDGRGPLRVAGLGIGSPGPINLHTGVLGLLPNLPGWESFPLRSALAEATGISVVLESDANAAAIAEWKLGAGQQAGLDTMVMITLGTGVGSGFILGGKIWHGMFGMGGEIGHSVIRPAGLLCGCGSLGCLEMYASAGGLLRFAQEIARSETATAAFRNFVHNSAITPAQIEKFAQAGDASAKRVFEYLGEHLGLGLANLISSFDPPMIIVGGGVAGAWSLFAPAMFGSVRKHSVVYRLAEPTQTQVLERDHTFIGPALLGAKAGLLGAGLLPHLASRRWG